MNDLNVDVLTLQIQTFIPFVYFKNNCVRLYLQFFIGGFTSYLCYLCLPVYSGVQHFVILYVFTLLVPFCDVRYDFYIKMMSGSSLSPVVCRRAHVLFMLFLFVCT